MELIFRDYQYSNELLNFTIKSDFINGITGKDKDKMIDIINLKRSHKGKIFIDNQEVLKNDIESYKRKINVIYSELEYATFIENIYQLLEYEIRRKKLVLKNPEKKIIDSLKIVGLNPEVLDRTIYSLSTSEKKLLQLAISLLSNPDVIIMQEPFKNLDIKNEKKMLILLQKIKEQYQKTIVFVSDDSTMLYKYTNHLIVFKNNRVIVEGNTTEIFQRVDFLKRNKVFIPEIVEFTYLAKKKKNVKIDYHKDIRDIIKDIYKHV